MLRFTTAVLSSAAALLLLPAAGCGPTRPDSQVPTVSGECIPAGDDDATDDDDAADDDDAVDDDNADDDDTADPDADGDGYPASEDCDDGDAALNLDDADGDGYSTCTGDCDDGDAALTPDDADGDGYSTCDGDCDDGDDTRSPGAAEDATDAGENDCDGRTDEVQLLYVVDDVAPDNEALVDALEWIAGACVEVRTTVAADDPAIATLDTAPFGAVVIEYRTDDGQGGWSGTASDVMALGLPVLALGTGGAIFLEEAGSGLEFSGVFTDATSTQVVVDAGHDVFNTPFWLLGAGPSLGVVGAPVSTHALSGSSGTVLAVHPDAEAYGLVIIDDTLGVRNLYLGFDAVGSDWSTVGGQLLANAVLFLGSSACSPSS